MCGNGVLILKTINSKSILIMEKKITISQDNYRHIINALRVAASFVEEKQVEINWGSSISSM